MIKYTSRIILGLLTVFWGLATWCALTPMEGYHHCESGQEELSPIYGVLFTIVSFVLLHIVWYYTEDRRLNRYAKNSRRNT